MANRNTIRISNPSLEQSQTTYLSQDCNAAATTLNVLDTSGFGAISAETDRYFVLIGSYGDEKSEIATVTAKTDSTFTVAATKFSHTASEPVILMPYNQIKVYGMLEETDDPTLIATVSIDTTANLTPYTYTGSDYSYFLVRYYRSIATAVESADSDTFSVNTFTQFSLKSIIESALVKAQTRIDENQNSILNWNKMIAFANEAMQAIKLRKRKWNFLHKTTSTNSLFLDMTTTASTAYLENVPTDISIIDSMKVDGDRINFISRLRYDNRSSDDIGKPVEYTIKNGGVYFYPVPDAAYDVEMSYYRDPATLTSLTDEVDKEFVYPVTLYLGAQAAFARGNDKRGDKLEKGFDEAMEMLIEEHTGEWQTGDAEGIEETSIYNLD